MWTVVHGGRDENHGAGADRYPPVQGSALVARGTETPTADGAQEEGRAMCPAIGASAISPLRWLFAH